MSEISLPYVEQGDASGVPVLMLHGGTDSWRSFEPVLPHLPDDIRAVAVTMRGHGDAPKPESGYCVEDLAGDVIALMEELDLGPAVLVGHSMGTMVAQRIAIEAPERVLGLVLGGAFGQPQANSPGLLELRAAFGEIQDPIPRELAHEFQASTTARPLDPGPDSAGRSGRDDPARGAERPARAAARRASDRLRGRRPRAALGRAGALRRGHRGVQPPGVLTE